MSLLEDFDKEKNELRKKIEIAPATDDVVTLMDSYLSRIHSDMGGINFQKSRNLGYLLEIVRYAVKTLVTVDKDIHHDNLQPERIQTESSSRHFVAFAKTVQFGICIALLVAFFSVAPVPWILVLLVIILMGIEIYLQVFNRKVGSKFKKHPGFHKSHETLGFLPARIDSKPKISRPQSFLNYFADSLSYVEKALNEQTPEKNGSYLEKEIQILRLFQDMFEAKTFNDGEWALKKVTQIQAILKENGIIVKEYDPAEPSDIHDFDVEPCADPSEKEYITIRPAFLRGKRVILRGRVAEPLT